MIRWKVFVPVFLILALIVWFAVYRLDFFVKGMIEDGISSITGTKTDITRLRISLFDSKLSVQKLEIASATEPFKNAAEFGGIIVDFQFLPLLEKRFVVDEFSITGIAWGTPRTSSGILPKKPVSEPSWFSGVVDEAMDSMKAEFKELPVNKLLDFEVPDNPKEVVERMDLQSLAAYKQAAFQAQDLRSRWTARYKDVKDISNYKKLAADARALGQNLPQDPEGILKRIESVQSVLKQIDDEKKKIETISDDVSNDFASVQKLTESAQAAFEADYQDAKGLVGFNALDTSTLTKMIFGQQWVDRAEAVIRFQNSIREKLAALSVSSKDESIQIQPRAKGRDIVFVRPQQKPSFVLAKSDFSVNAAAQNYEMKLRDINSAPKIYGKPTTVDIRGEFKDSMIGSAKIAGLWDYTKEIPKDVYNAEVKKIRASDWPVGIPKVFPVKISSGTANAKVDFDFVGPLLTWTNQVSFSNVTWNFSEVPKAGVLVPILTSVFADIKNFTMNFKIVYKEKKLSFDIVSDFDDALKKGVSKYLDQKFQDFQARLKRELDQKVGQAKDQAMAEIGKFQLEIKSKTDAALAGVTQSSKEGNQIVAQLQQKVKDAAAKKASDELKKNLPGLKNLPKLKFP